MFTLIILALWCWSRGSHKGFLIFVSIALALTAARRLNNAITAWTDLMDLRTYAWLAKLMWIPTVAAWTMAWNRWSSRPWRSIDGLALVVAVAEIFGAFIPSVRLTSVSRLASIALFVLIGARIVRSRSMGILVRILALVTLASVMASIFGAELLDPIGLPGIWFPFGIGVSRSQYIYAIVIPLMAMLMTSNLDQISLSRRPQARSAASE